MILLTNKNIDNLYDSAPDSTNPINIPVNPICNRIVPNNAVWKLFLPANPAPTINSITNIQYIIHTSK